MGLAATPWLNIEPARRNTRHDLVKRSSQDLKDARGFSGSKKTALSDGNTYWPRLRFVAMYSSISVIYGVGKIARSTYASGTQYYSHARLVLRSRRSNMIRRKCCGRAAISVDSLAVCASLSACFIKITASATSVQG